MTTLEDQFDKLDGISRWMKICGIKEIHHESPNGIIFDIKPKSDDS